MTECCKNCRFWKTQEVAYLPTGEMMTAPACKRYPPVMGIRDGSYFYSGQTAYFPSTGEDEYCGEFVHDIEKGTE